MVGDFLADLPSIAEAEAVERFNLKKVMSRFSADHGSGTNIRFKEGDLHIENDLVLDFDDQMIKGKIKYDSVWQNHQGLVVTGNLIVDGSIMNAESDFGNFLLVYGNLKAKNLIGGGSDIVIMGDAQIEEVVLGHYNDGCLEVMGETRTQLFISDDHACEIKTLAPTWNLHDDVVAMPLSDYLHHNISVDRWPEDEDQADFVLTDEFESDDIIEHIRSGHSALRQSEDTRRQTSKEQWCRIVGYRGRALQHVPAKLIDAGLCNLAVEQNGYALRFVPEELRTAELCEMAVVRNGYAINFVPECLQTPALFTMAVADDGEMLEYVPIEARTLAICVAAVTDDDDAMEFVPEPLRDAVMRAIAGS